MRDLLKKGSICVLSAAIAFSGIIFEKDAETVEAAQEYVLSWSEEFNGTALNRDVWNVEVNGNGGGNNELQYYLDDEDNIQVSNGTLKINALKEDYSEVEGGRVWNYTSGRITTQSKKTFKYGKLEAKIKLPQFKGAWPAFWTLGQSFGTEGWPKCGEIDIMEAINDENFTYGAAHWYGNGGQSDNSNSSAGKLPADYQRTEWHTYGIEWTETVIRFYVDGEVFFRQPIVYEDTAEFHKEQFVILNLAIGGRWPGYTIDDTAFPNNTTMEVDYVRYYELQEVETEAPTTTQDPEAEKQKIEKQKVQKTKTVIKQAKRISKKKAKIKIKKIAGADGYVMKVSTKKNFNKGKVRKITSKKRSKIVKKLKAGKKYYVKARAYKLINGEKVYTKWSKKTVIKKKVAK